MNIFLKKIRKKIIILDIPLLLENKINKKGDILIFVQSKEADILKKLKKEKILILNYLINLRIFNFHLITNGNNHNL